MPVPVPVPVPPGRPLPMTAPRPRPHSAGAAGARLGGGVVPGSRVFPVAMSPAGLLWAAGSGCCGRSGPVQARCWRPTSRTRDPALLGSGRGAGAQTVGCGHAVSPPRPAPRAFSGPSSRWPGRPAPAASVSPASGLSGGLAAPRGCPGVSGPERLWLGAGPRAESPSLCPGAGCPRGLRRVCQPLRCRPRRPVGTRPFGGRECCVRGRWAGPGAALRLPFTRDWLEGRAPAYGNGARGAGG